MDVNIKRWSAKWRLVVAMFFMAQSVSSSADSGDTINFSLNHAVTYDDNLFKLDKDESPQSSFGKSQRWEIINATTAGVSLSKEYSLQKFKIDVSQTAYRYQNYNFLNFDGTNYDIKWDWAITPYLTGNISLDRQQLPNTFADIRNINPLTTNTRTVKVNQIYIDWSPYGNWHLFSNGYDVTADSDNSNVGQDNLDFTFKETSVRAGLRYQFNKGSSIEYSSTKSNGSYGDSNFNEVLFTDRGYKQNRDELSLRWALSGKSRLDAKTAFVTRNNDNFGQRDFDGWVSNISYQWDMTGKVRLTFNAISNLRPAQATTYSYVRENTISFTPNWSLTDKMSLKGDLSYIKRDYEGFSPTATIDRVDHIRRGSLTFDWRPRRFLGLELMVRREVRDSNVEDIGYVSNVATMSAILTF